MAIKVTEMTEATQVNNNDLFMIVQNGENKKITKENLQDSIVDAALASYNSRIVALEQAILNANRSTPVENTRKSNEVIEEPKEEVVNDNKDEPKEEIKEKR